MNPNEQEIESLLRHAPKPSPAGVEAAIVRSRTLVQTPGSTSHWSVTTPLSGGWLRRWWPALVPQRAALAGAVVLAFQQMEIQDLQETIRTLFKESSGRAANLRCGIKCRRSPALMRQRTGRQ
ncbi:MAG: hypothetical protein V9H26_13605 [Verrucomicrobiota bacterium]